MNEEKNDDLKLPKNDKFNTHIKSESFPEQSIAENSSFDVGAEEAARILGINRTRLSQLTSRGIFLYERRKVDTRSRLFYRLNDILSYRRSRSHGGTLTTPTAEYSRRFVSPVSSPKFSDIQEKLPDQYTVMVPKNTFSLNSPHSPSLRYQRPSPSFQSKQISNYNLSQAHAVAARSTQHHTLQTLMETVNLLKTSLEKHEDLLTSIHTACHSELPRTIRLGKEKLRHLHLIEKEKTYPLNERKRQNSMLENTLEPFSPPTINAQVNSFITDSEALLLNTPKGESEKKKTLLWKKRRVHTTVPRHLRR